MDVVNSLDEIIDVVDEKDDVIGQAARKDIHNPEKPLKHREVLILVHDDLNKVLIQQRSKNKLQAPLMWTISAAGHVKAGMEPIESAKEELFEELGLSGEIEFVRKEYVEGNRDNNRFIYWFFHKYDGGEINFEKEEIEQVRLVDEQNLKKMLNDKEFIHEGSISFIREFWEKKRNS